MTEGQVFLSTWYLQPNMTIQYAIKYNSPEPPQASHKVKVSDVFVSLDEVVKFLTTDRVKPQDIQTTWTIIVNDKQLTFCPLAEFVIFAALQSSSKLFKDVFEGILDSIVKDLHSSTDLFSDDEGTSKLTNYTEKLSVNDYFNSIGDNFEFDSEMETNKSETTSELGGCIDNDTKEEITDHENLEIKRTKEENSKQMDRDDDKLSNKKKRKSRAMPQDEIHTCNLCGKTFKSTLRLYRHQLQLHHDQKDFHVEKPLSAIKMETKAKWQEGDDTERYESGGNFKCEECNKSFLRLLPLIFHCRREHPDKPEICPSEPLKLGLLETLHERTPDNGPGGEEIFTCGLSLCNMKFTRFRSLVHHERTHREAFICILCGICCFSATELIVHCDNLHQKKSEFICRVCGFFNRREENLKTHQQQEHLQGTVMWQCEHCSYSTEKKMSLHSHKRSMHKNREFFCDICGKKYASGPSLYIHKKSHDPDFKKLQCKLCPTKFAFSSGLTYHMAVHSGEKPFTCNQCGQNFGSHTAQSRHIKVVHAEEKDMIYQCEQCGKRFNKRLLTEYKDHLKMHTGERDIICSECGKTYFSRKQLRKHRGKKHPKKSKLD